MLKLIFPLCLVIAVWLGIKDAQKQELEASGFKEITRELTQYEQTALELRQLKKLTELSNQNKSRLDHQGSLIKQLMEADK